MGIEKDSSRVEARLLAVVGVMATDVTAPLDTERASFFRSEVLEAGTQLARFEVATRFWLFAFVVSKLSEAGGAEGVTVVAVTADEEDDVDDFAEATTGDGFVGVEANNGGDLGTVEKEGSEGRPAVTGVDRVGEDGAAADGGEPRDIGDTMVARDRVDGGMATETGLTTGLPTALGFSAAWSAALDLLVLVLLFL